MRRTGVSGLSCTAETACAARAGIKLVDDVECDLKNRNDDKLGEAVERVEGEALFAAVPGRYHDLALIIGVDQSDQIAEYDSVLMAEARARRVRTYALVAALGLFALGAGLAYRAWRGESPAAPFDAAVAAAADDLRGAEPTLLADLSPLTPAERAGGTSDAPRSGVRILEPVGTLLSPLAQVVWEPVPGATLYVVTISDAKTGAAIGSMKTKGTLVATAGKALLVPGGAYLVEVAATGDLGSPKASRAFQVASVQVAREFTAAAALLERRAKPRDVAYLTASLAIRKGLLLEAEKVLARAVAQGPRELGPSHPAFEATVDLRAHVRRLLSWSPVPSPR